MVYVQCEVYQNGTSMANVLILAVLELFIPNTITNKIMDSVDTI